MEAPGHEEIEKDLAEFMKLLFEQSSSHKQKNKDKKVAKPLNMNAFSKQAPVAFYRAFYLGNSLSEYSFNTKTLGFSLAGRETPKNEMKDVYGDGNKEGENNIKITWEYLGLLMNTFMFNSAKGQINSARVAENVITIDTGMLETTDFSSPALDKERGTLAPNDESFKTQFMEDYKKEFIKRAFNETISFFKQK